MGFAKIKQLTLILTLLLLTGCRPAISTEKAVYFYREDPELSLEELHAHPEILVVQNFEELKKYAHQKIALWVDKGATPFDAEQEKWINEAPQAYYPIVLIGTRDTLYAFRDLLRLCCFMGPGQYPGYDAPGFSVIQWKETHAPESRTTIFLQGYHQKPTVGAILEITNALLEGKAVAIPTVTGLPQSCVYK